MRGGNPEDSCESFALENKKSRTGQRELAETATTRDLCEDELHLGNDLVCQVRKDFDSCQPCVR